MSPRRAAVATLAALILAFPGATADAASEPPGVEARSWALIDARSGDVLASHAGAERLPVASTTKLMTAWVAMREMPLDEIVRAAPYESTYGESLLEFRAGQRISVRDLLYGLILRSGNDAAQALAVAAAGSVPRFVRQMNRSAAALGLADTHYANPIGLDQPGNYSSAFDLATLTRRLLRIPAFAKIADARTALLRSLQPAQADLDDQRTAADGPVGDRGEDRAHLRRPLCPGRLRQRKGVQLISAVVGAPSDEGRYTANLDLLEYGFSLYRKRTPVRPARTSPNPRSGTPAARSRCAPPAPSPSAFAAGSDRSCGSGRRPRSRGRSAAAPSSAGRPCSSAAGRPARWRCGRAARSPRPAAFDRVRHFVDNNLVPLALAMFVILMVGVLLYRRLTRGNEQKGPKRVNAK